MLEDIDKVLVRVDQTVSEVIERLQKNRRAIGVVIAEDNELLGVITDYDIRNGILNNLRPTDTVEKWLEIKSQGTWRTSPIKVLNTASNEEVIETMTKHNLGYLPVVDENNKLVDLITKTPTHADVKAVVMAGGFGTRLMPLTKDNPKPMLDVGGKPLLERTISHLNDFNIKDLVISTHYKAEKIMDYFGDGESFDINIKYVKEDSPLGTAGALRLIEQYDSDHILVANGDILTDMDYSSMINFHKNKDAEITVGLIQEDISIPYGVVALENSVIKSIEEKPTFTYMFNAGIYVLKKSAIDHIPENTKYDMTDLVNKFIEEKRNIVGYPIMENWIDIGNVEEYKKANTIINNLDLQKANSDLKKD